MRGEKVSRDLPFFLSAVRAQPVWSGAHLRTCNLAPPRTGKRENVGSSACDTFKALAKLSALRCSCAPLGSDVADSWEPPKKHRNTGTRRCVGTYT